MYNCIYVDTYMYVLCVLLIKEKLNMLRVYYGLVIRLFYGHWLAFQFSFFNVQCLMLYRTYCRIFHMFAFTFPFLRSMWRNRYIYITNYVPTYGNDFFCCGHCSYCYFMIFILKFVKISERKTDTALSNCFLYKRKFGNNWKQVYSIDVTWSLPLLCFLSNKRELPECIAVSVSLLFWSTCSTFYVQSAIFSKIPDM